MSSNTKNNNIITIERKRFSTKGLTIEFVINVAPDNWEPLERLLPHLSSIPFQVIIDCSAKNSNIFTKRTLKIDITLTNQSGDDTLLVISKEYTIASKASQLVKTKNRISDTLSYHLEIPINNDTVVEDADIADLNEDVLNAAKVFRLTKIMHNPTDDAYVEAMDQLRHTKERREMGIKRKLIEKHLKNIRPQIVVRAS